MRGSEAKYLLTQAVKADEVQMFAQDRALNMTLADSRAILNFIADRLTDEEEQPDDCSCQGDEFNPYCPKHGNTEEI